MRYLSVCSGIEAASVAWQGLGWKPVAFSEVEPFAAAVLKERFPHVPNLGDMQSITAAQIAALGGADLLVGGTPCQPFSAAGQRAGFADERGNLTLGFCRLADDLHVTHVVWENVPGVLSHDQGRTFAHILSLLSGADITAPPDGWRNAGAAWGPKRALLWRVLDAQYFGVPQRRRRVFVYAVALDQWRMPFRAFWTPDRSREGVRLLGLSLRLEQISTALIPPGWRRTRRFERASVTAGECITLQLSETPAPDAVVPSALTDVLEPWGPQLERYRLSTPVCQRILTRAGQRRRSLPRLLHAALMQSGVAEVHDGVDPHLDREIVTSLCASFGTSGIDLAHAQAGWLVVQEVSTFKPSYYTRGKDGAPAAVSPPLAADADRGDQDLCIFESRFARNGRGAPRAVVPALRAYNGDHGTGDGAPLLLTPTIVRRLTPIEWERLQGLPPGWTDIAFRGRRATDGPRYRAIGNSMAVPCMRWLGQRIAATHQAISTFPLSPARAIWCWRSLSSQYSS